MIKNYKEKLKEIFDYSIVNNSFNKATMVCNAKNVCVFGLGTYFREAFVSPKIKEKNVEVLNSYTLM